MKKSYRLLVLPALIAFSASLAACSAQTQQVTVTSEVTVTLPPTFTATPPLTLTPTLIPASATPEQPAEADLTPEQLATIEGYNADWNGVLTIKPETLDPETGLMKIYLSEDGILSKAGEGPEVKGMGYNPDTGKMDLSFWSDGLNRMFEQSIDPDFISYERGADGNPVDVKNIVKVFTIGEDGQLERVMAQDDGGESQIPINTPLVLNQMILEDSSDDPHWRVESLAVADELLKAAADEGIYVVGNNGYYYLKKEDLYAKILGGNAWYGNTLDVWNDETQNFEEKKVANYRVVALDSPYYPGHDVGVVFWMGQNGIRVELVAGPPNINRMGHQYDEDADLRLAAFGYGE